MKKGVIIDLIHSKINGGRPNTDMSITKSQIAALLPAAINYVMTGDYWANMNLEGDKEIPGAFITELNSKLINVDDRGREFVWLHEAVAHFNGNAAVRTVEDCLGNRYSPRTQSVTRTVYWDTALPGLQEFSLRGKKLILHNKPELVDQIFIGVMLDPSYLSDNDELPIPAGREPEVIDMLNRFFSEESMVPKDFIINGVDPRKDEAHG